MLAIYVSSPTSGCGPKNMNTFYGWDKYLISSAVILFIIAEGWNQPRCPPSDEGVNSTCFIYSMEHYSGMKGMNFQALHQNGCERRAPTLSEISWTQKSRHYMFSLVCGSVIMIRRNICVTQCSCKYGLSNFTTCQTNGWECYCATKLL